MGTYVPQPDDDEVIDSREAAAMLSTTRKTLQNWCSARRRGERRGRIGPPFTQVGRSLKFRKGDVRRYLHEHYSGDGDAA